MACILGIDPGLASTGWGVITSERGRVRCCEYGVIRTPAKERIGRRLVRIYEGVSAVIERFNPTEAGIEALFFSRNVSSAIPVAQARGVVFFALERAGVVSREFTPQVIKQAVVGGGGADKEQVTQMVRVILGLSDPPRPDHAADALAAAIACANARM